MLLFKNSQNTYLAIANEVAITNVHGYEICFQGDDVPEIICRAFIRDYGGFLIREIDENHVLNDEPTVLRRAA